MFDDTARGIVDSVIEGYNGTVFAYGQTGAGKTFTMEGVEDPPEYRGIIANSFSHIFDTIEHTSAQKVFLVQVSMMEIYNEQIRDLIGRDPKQALDLKDSKDRGVYVKNLTFITVKNLQDVDKVLKAGRKNRSVASTMMNQESSRSHSIITIRIETSEKSAVDNQNHIKGGKLNMVDLAGSERPSKTGAKGEQFKEGIEINLSLSALGNVISALVNPKAQHIPYRDSKLTRLLQDSLGGNTKTVMVANISPADDNKEETLSTLRYASRAKNIKNKPIVNEDPKDAMLKAFQEEIIRLKKALEERGGVPSSLPSPSSNGDMSHGNIISSSIDEEKLKEMMTRNEEEKQRLVESMKNQSEEEKKKLLLEQQKIEEERQKIENELKRRREQLEKEKREREILKKKLAEMQSNIVQGGNELIELNREQEEQIKRQKEELERRRQEELRLKREMDEQMDERLALEEQYANIQEEVDVKTKKLKKLWNKFQLAKAEINDLQQEFQQEREDYLFTIRQLERELRLKAKIIDNFIPKSEVEKITKRAVWDEEIDDFKIRNIHLAGNNIDNRSQLSTARLTNNIIELDLDMPERTTQDYEVYDDRSNAVDGVTSFVMGDSTDNVFFSYGAQSQKKEKKRVPTAGTKSRPKTANRRQSPEEDDFPQAKGLVKSKRNA